MNISLLSKWWWKLDKGNGLWQQIIKYKYIKNGSITTVSHRQNDSAVWNDLLKIKDVYLYGRQKKWLTMVNTLFWKDTCCLINPYINSFIICLISVSNWTLPAGGEPELLQRGGEPRAQARPLRPPLGGSALLLD